MYHLVFLLYLALLQYIQPLSLQEKPNLLKCVMQQGAFWPTFGRSVANGLRISGHQRNCLRRSHVGEHRHRSAAPLMKQQNVAIAQITRTFNFFWSWTVTPDQSSSKVGRRPLTFHTHFRVLTLFIL